MLAGLATGATPVSQVCEYPGDYGSVPSRPCVACDDFERWCSHDHRHPTEFEYNGLKILTWNDKEMGLGRIPLKWEDRTSSPSKPEVGGQDCQVGQRGRLRSATLAGQ